MRDITMMQAQFAAETQTGETLHFENCKGGYFSDKEEYGLKVVGKTTQETLTGKNLFDINGFVTAPSGGQSNDFVVDGDIIYGAGKYAYFSGNYILFEVIPNNAYTFSGQLVGGKMSYYVRECDPFDSEPKWMPLKNVDNVSTVSITVMATRPYIGLAFWKYDDSNGKVGIRNLQLERSSTATSYEPYCSGIPAPNPDYPMPIQCVKAGTTITCGECTITTPCDLYEGDIWYPISGRVDRHNGVISSYNSEAIPSGYTSTTGGLDVGATVVYTLDTPIIEQYDPQPIFAPPGTVNVLQSPVELAANLEATMLVRR